MEERSEVCQFQELQDLFLALLPKLNGISSNWLKLLFLMEERREVFQFQEQLVLFQDLQLKPNGINSNLLKLLF